MIYIDVFDISYACIVKNLDNSEVVKIQCDLVEKMPKFIDS